MSNSTSSADNRTIYQAPPGKAPRNPMPKWWLTSVILGGLFAFLLVVGRAEISRWYCASAQNALKDGLYEDAITAANNGLSWDPDYVRLMSIRASANNKLKKFEDAIADYDQLIELALKDDPFGESVLQAKASKASALQQLDRYDGAIEILSEIVEFREDDYHMRNDSKSQYAYALALNNRAYIQALAHVKETDDIDIEQALADIEQATDLRGADDPIMVDTLGYLQLLNGKHEEAFYHLDQATKMTEESNSRLKIEVREEMHRAVDQRPYEDLIRQLDEQLAVILHHRGEAHQALGDDEKAKSDIDRAVELGFNPEEGVW